jgi:hypothetical protein
MNPQEMKILDEIEAAMRESDAAFVTRMASGPRLSRARKVGLVAATIAGLTLVMMFSANVVLGLAGYVLLVAVGTMALRSRPLQPAQQSPVELLHRFTGGLFRNPAARREPDKDQV